MACRCVDWLVEALLAQVKLGLFQCHLIEYMIAQRLRTRSVVVIFATMRRPSTEKPSVRVHRMALRSHRDLDLARLWIWFAAAEIRLSSAVSCSLRPVGVLLRSRRRLSTSCPCTTLACPYPGGGEGASYARRESSTDAGLLERERDKRCGPAEKRDTAVVCCEVVTPC